MKRAALAFLACASPAAAQVEPIASGLDPRIQNVHFVSGQAIRLQIPQYGMLGILLAPGEYVQNATLRDPGSYKITVVGTADALFVQAIGGQRSVLSLATDKRSYEFELNTSNETNIPYLVRFAPEMAASAQLASATAAPSYGSPGQYKLSGNKALRPSGMRDDGMRTYIQWNADQAIPAVFALDALDREEMVNGYMRDGLFTIDRVHERLVFRIDKAMSTARRFIPKATP